MLGGTFDPIHFGHLAIAEQAAEALELDKVLFMPARQPVHKDAARAPADDRVRMIELATADNPRFELSRLEVDADRPSYTADTLEELTERYPERDWVIIVSAEAARAFPTWRRPERILELARVAVVPRLGYEELSMDFLAQRLPGSDARFTILPTSHLGHSSTDIRARVEAGKSIRYLVPPAVEAYIGDHRLYAGT
jgi:nicotinate-nucleotide adenylyltransferase